MCLLIDGQFLDDGFAAIHEEAEARLGADELSREASVEDEFIVHIQLIAVATSTQSKVIGAVALDLELATAHRGKHDERCAEDAAVLGIERKDEITLGSRRTAVGTQYQTGGDAAFKRDSGLDFHVGGTETQVRDLPAGAGPASIRSTGSQLPFAGGDAARVVGQEIYRWG